ncbi:MAG: ABC transporter permease, partial [Anaerolineae bacterium]|nr:ABC transporter permease [Anaerolineae bacterium]
MRIGLSSIALAWAGKLAIRRLGAQWRSLLTIIAGVLLAASVGALIPLYMTAVAQVSLVERLNNQLPPHETNAAASVALIPSALATDQDLRLAEDRLDADVRALADRHLAQAFPGWLDRVVFYGETSALAIDPPPVIDDEGEARIPDPVARVFLAYYEDWPALVSLIAGRLPQEPPAAGPDVDVEIAIPFEAQTALGINAGDVLDLDQGGPRGGWPSSRNVRALVVGIVSAPETPSPLERAYFMSPSPLRFTETGGEYQAEFAVLAERAAFERVATDFIPDTPVRVGWRFRFDHSRLAFSRSPDARAALLDFQGALTAMFRDVGNADLQPTYGTRLIDFQTSGGQAQDQGILIDYEQSVRSLDAPFGLLLLQVGALVLFYLVVTAALVRRGERREIAMLQSRGANDGSLILERGLEAALICLGAAAIAPVLSQQIIILVTPFFARYQDLPLLLTPQAFLFAGVMAAVAFVALISTLRPVLRLPLISAGGAASRSERQPWWQRYYLDVVLVILGALALLRLVGRDTPLFSTSAGSAASDPFLLLAPALLFLGLGSVLLRLFPVLAAGAARLLAAGRGLLGPLATWQLSREPLHYGRITFLLALAIGIGWFATSFRATVSRSQTDQAQYRAGSDVRVTERDLRLNASRARPREAYTALPGVEAASVVWRRPGVNFQPDPTRPAIPTTILAVESATFPGAVYWRDDLGELGLPGAPDNALPERGAELPFAPASLGLWARFDVPGPFGPHIADLDRLRNRTTLYARLLDANGTWLIAPFALREIEYASTGAQQPGLGGGGAFVANGWAYFEADVVRES